MAGNGTRQNMVLFPFMAQGHIIPFMALAQHISQKGFSITFVSTPSNITNLKKSHQNRQSPSSSITFVELPFKASDHGLPPDLETTDPLPLSLMAPFTLAVYSLSHHFKDLIFHLTQNQEKPICVISDMFFDWTIGIAREFGIFHAVFSPTGGFGMACYYSTWLNLPQTQSFVEFELPDFPEAGKINTGQLSPVFRSETATEFFQKVYNAWGNSDGLLLNTAEGMDGKGLNYFRRKLGIPVFGIGPLSLFQENRASPNQETAIETEECLQWLDRKDEGSVLYICFGSQRLNSMPASHMMKLANALDSSGRNFIWVLRPPLEFDKNVAEFVAEEWLPDGFLNRVRDQDRGLIIVQKWAPQMEILAHKSVGGFISHCGWNSAMEAIKNRVPILSWPMGADQYYNEKFLVEEVGVCVELARGTDAEIMEEDIVGKIELLMGENDKGKEIRKKVSEVNESLRDGLRDEDNYKGSSVKAMEKLFIAVASNMGKHKNN